MFETCGLLFSHGLRPARDSSAFGPLPALDALPREAPAHPVPMNDEGSSIASGSRSAAMISSTAASRCGREGHHARARPRSGIIRRLSIRNFEAEMNVIMYADEGRSTSP